MASVSTYLHFHRNAEEAFSFYKAVFGTQFDGDGIMRYKDIPPAQDIPALPDDEQNLIMHVALPILAGHLLMGGDIVESMGGRPKQGNNVYINLEPDTRAQTLELFKALSNGGRVEHELRDEFWGDYFGSCVDKFGIHWMFNCAEKPK